MSYSIISGSFGLSLSGSEILVGFVGELVVGVASDSEIMMN